MLASLAHGRLMEGLGSFLQNPFGFGDLECVCGSSHGPFRMAIMLTKQFDDLLKVPL